jgi:transposase
MRDSNVLKRQYTDEFKAEAVRLGQSVGQHEAARRLGVPAATLGNWYRRGKKALPQIQGETAALAAGLPARRPVGELEAENSRLRRELADAKLDVEILRKATAYFAKGSR